MIRIKSYFTDWDNIFSQHTPDKKFIFKIFKLLEKYSFKKLSSDHNIGIKYADT